MKDGTPLIVGGVVMALGGAYMAQGVWGVITAVGFLAVVFGWVEYMAMEVISAVNAGRR
jgi:hypothetical protein